MLNEIATNEHLISMIKNQQAILEDLEKQVQQRNTAEKSSIFSINPAPNGYLSYFDAYCNLIKRLYLSDKLIQPIKQTQRSRMFEVFSLDTFYALVDELIEDETEKKIFCDFVESMSLIIFKEDDKKVLVTENNRRVNGAMILKDKFAKILDLQNISINEATKKSEN